MGGLFQHADRERRQECRVGARGDHVPGPGGQGRGEPPVGDPGPAVDPPGADASRQFGHGRLLATVVAGQGGRGDGAQARSHDLHPCRQLLYGRDHRLEGPGRIHRVVLRHEQGRATGLGLTPAHPTADPGGASGSRAGQHPAGLEHRDRSCDRHPGRGGSGDHRPVRAPQHECAHRYPASGMPATAP